MPAAEQYILDTNSQEYQQHERDHADELRARSKRFDRNWKYYRAEMDKPLRKERDKVDDNVLLPMIGPLVDRIVSFLLGDGITFDAGADDEETGADANLEALWLANQQQILLHKTGLSGSLTGHNFMRVEPNPKKGEPPIITRINPAHAVIFWPIDDIEKTLWYRLQYQLGKFGKRIDYVKGQRVDDTHWNHDAPGWMELTFTVDPDGGRWQLQSERPWPHAWSPIHDWQNLPLPDERYGADDVTAAVALNDELNLLASQASRIIKHHASPRTVIIGATTEEFMPSGIGTALTISKPRGEVDVFNLEMQSDLAALMKMVAIVQGALWQSGRMVDPQIMKDKVGMLTNFGVRVLYNDALDKTETKRLLYGEALEAIGKHALELWGKPVPKRIKTDWPQSLPEDRILKSESVIMEMNTDPPIIDAETAREELGYDNDKIVQRLKDPSNKRQNVPGASGGNTINNKPTDMARAAQRTLRPTPTNGQQT